MSTLAITFSAGGNTGAQLRKLATQIENLSMGVPDVVPTGADTVLTIDNGPSAGTASVQITAGPYQSSKFYI